MFNKFFIGINFIKRYLFRDFFYIFYYGYFRLHKKFELNVLFYNNDEFFNEIKNGKSLIRLGDGEFGMIHGRDIHYQKYSRDLQKYLIKIISEYNSSSDYLIGIPLFVNYNNEKLNEKVGRLSCWLPLKIEFWRRFNKKSKYFDAHLFYYKSFFQENLEEYFKNKKFIIHTESRNIKNQKNNMEKKFHVLGWVQALSKNSFDNYEIDKRNILKIVEKNKKNINNIILLGAAGPSSKIICYELGEMIQCIDLGKGIEQLYNDINFEYQIQNAL